jgi:carbamoylphosphate synthase small subunit
MYKPPCWEDDWAFRRYWAKELREGGFNTSMTGYQKSPDPSYKGQIITMTYTLIGNYGINPEDVESRGSGRRVYCEGVSPVSFQLAS